MPSDKLGILSGMDGIISESVIISDDELTSSRDSYIAEIAIDETTIAIRPTMKHAVIFNTREVFLCGLFLEYEKSFTLSLS
jgi:hypothetical protein